MQVHSSPRLETGHSPLHLPTLPPAPSLPRLSPHRPPVYHLTILTFSSAFSNRTTPLSRRRRQTDPFRPPDPAIRHLRTAPVPLCYDPYCAVISRFSSCLRLHHTPQQSHPPSSLDTTKHLRPWPAITTRCRTTSKAPSTTRTTPTAITVAAAGARGCLRRMRIANTRLNGAPKRRFLRRRHTQTTCVCWRLQRASNSTTMRYSVPSTS